MLNPKVSPPMPHSTPNPMAFMAAEPLPVSSSPRVCPAGTASNAPSTGKTNHAKTPCVSQKLSHDQFFTLLIGT